VEVRISPLIRSVIDIADSVEVNGETVRECLDDLMSSYPDIKDVLFDRNGVMKAIILLGGKSVPSRDYSITDVSDSDTISILMPMSGG